jgi:hypothetical protein
LKKTRRIEPVASSRIASKIVKPGRRVRISRAERIVPKRVAGGAPAERSRMGAARVRSS